MANNRIDPLFASLSDPTRRAVIERLADGPAPVKTLAEPHTISLPSFLKHLDVLERAGIVSSVKSGRQRIVTLRAEALAPAQHWLDRQRAIWETRTDRLEALAKHLDSHPAGKDTP